MKIIDIGDVRTGDILLSTGEGFVSESIMETTGSVVSHGAMVAKPFATPYVTEAIGHGVSDRAWRYYIEDKTGSINVYRLKPKYEHNLIKGVFFDIIADIVGAGYNYDGIIEFYAYEKWFIGDLKDDDTDKAKKRFCFQYISETYRRMGIDLVQWRPDHLTDGKDLMASPYLECIGAIEP